MKISDLAQPRRAKHTAQVFESQFGATSGLDTVSHRQARAMIKKVQGLLAEHRRTPEFHGSENNPAYLKLMMMEQVLRQRLNEADTVMPTGTTGTNPTGANDAQQQAKQKQAQQQMINKVSDPTLKAAMKASSEGKTLTPQQQQSMANSMGAGAIDEDSSSWMVKAKTAEGATKTFRVHAGSEKEALSKFEQHHNQAKVISVSPEKQLDELSKDTLKSYAKKAAVDTKKKALDAASLNAFGDASDATLGRAAKASHQSTRRQVGINRAIDKLANESIRHSLRRALTESELSQAQVVLAAKDLSDRVQKMLEDASNMQVKDLAALVDEIKSDIGVDQANQYQQQAGELLGTLVQTLQATKTGLDSALGIVTGQGELEVPGEETPDMGMETPDMGMEMPPSGEEGPPAPLEEPAEEPGTEAPGALGRERR